MRGDTFPKDAILVTVAVVVVVAEVGGWLLTVVGRFGGRAVQCVACASFPPFSLFFSRGPFVLFFRLFGGAARGPWRSVVRRCAPV